MIWGGGSYRLIKLTFTSKMQKTCLLNTSEGLLWGLRGLGVLRSYSYSNPYRLRHCISLVLTRKANKVKEVTELIFRIVCKICHSEFCLKVRVALSHSLEGFLTPFLSLFSNIQAHSTSSDWFLHRMRVKS